MQFVGARLVIVRSAALFLSTTALTTVLGTPVSAADIVITANTAQTINLDPLLSGPSTLTINSGVSVTATPGSAAVVATTAPWTVTNGGTVSAATNGVGGVQLTRGGTITNNQGATISNTVGLGVYIYGGPSVVNNRGIVAAQRSGVVLGDGLGTAITGSITNDATGRITSIDASGILFQDPGSITITNAGTVEGARQGVGMASGTLTNTGTIRSTNTITTSDAVTIFSGVAAVTNSGRIAGASFYTASGSGPVGTGSSGIRVQEGARLTLSNLAGGEVSSTTNAIHVVGATNGSSVTNSGLIQTQNAGATIYFEGGSGAVTNNAGGQILAAATPPAQFASLSGAIAMTGANGAVTNNGLIRGYVLLGASGTIANGAGARIEGNAGVFNSTTSPIISTTLGFSGSLSNAGTITGNAGAATVTNTGTIGGGINGSTVTNAGTVAGTITMTGGNDSLTLQTGSSIGGAIDAGAGTDTLILEGSGTATNVFSNFETLSMRGTEWTLSGNSTFGAVSVQSGFLNINGTVVGGPIALGAGAGVRGSGRIQAAVTNSGGTVTPGGTGTIGTLTIAGNYTQGAAGRLIIDANEAGQADRLTVTGQAQLQGGVLQLAAVDGAWSVARTYTILSADGGVTGQFATTELHLAYLTPTLSYSANAVSLVLGRATAEIQEDIVKETTEQQISTATRKTTATVESRIDEVIALSMPMAQPEAEQQSGMLPTASYGGITSLSAGDSSDGWGAWATLTPTFVDQDLILPGQATAQRVDGETWDMFAGADKLLAERAVVGALAGFETSHYELKGSNGERRAEGPLVAAYAGVLITDWLYATGQLNHAWFDNKLTESAFGTTAPVTGKFDSKRLTASASVTARHEIERVKLAGKIGYAYTRETFEAYRASDGTAVSPDRSKLGRLTLGGEAAYRGELITPYVLVSFERDVEVNTSPGEREGFVLGGGARLLSGRYSVDVYGNAETGRAGESAVSLGLNVRMAF